MCWGDKQITVLFKCAAFIAGVSVREGGRGRGVWDDIILRNNNDSL